MRTAAPPNRLFELRSARGLTLPALAQLVGTSAGQIWKLENGKVNLTHAWMMRLAPALQCRPVDLLFDAPPSAIHIDSEMLTSAVHVACVVLNIDATPPKEVVLAEMIAQIYDVLVDTVREQGIIDERTIDTLIRTHRRARFP